ncbi:hypothetical protein [Ferruginibacter sp. SUN106]|uniref:hypothetical protein n=1 Tax=Ferruginibacter sp. SUN106 TaxID=2978348 RepID=UPI003D367F39
MANNLNLDGIQKILGESMQSLTDSSLSMLKPVIDGMMSNVNDMSKSVYGNGGTFKMPQIKIPQLKLQDSCNCCPPEENCPPHCIASIKRCAMVGERIIVPFMIKNTCSHTKTFRVGVRELNDENGTLAPEQPKLNKTSVTLTPGRSEQVLLMLDLAKFANGSTYTTEIVMREKDINQNICFTLVIDDHNAITAEPKDEQQYKLKWQSWKTHFYCEPKRNIAGTNVLTNTATPVNK